MATRRQLTRRGFLRAAAAAGGALAVGALGYRRAHDAASRNLDPARSQALLASVQAAPDPDALPNVVLIVADDLGYGDVSCYNDGPIRTPHVDAMAADGARLTDAYAGAALCSPSRASLLTGRYSIRSHITVPLYPHGSPMDLAFDLSGAYRLGVRGMPTDEVLLGEILQRRGYRTALIGKWHLGDRSPHLPNENGFDRFYGAYYSNNHEPYEIYRDREVDLPAPVDQDALTGHLTREAVAFIHENRARPFFLYYALPFPHAPVHASPAFRGRSAAGLYGDCVEELDWSVGQVLAALREAGLDERTLVIFTSDNGPWWEGNPGLARGRKNLPLEGGFRVPFVARWPGTIPAGVEPDAMTMNFDVFATCLAAAGVPPPADRIVDGCDLLPLLRGEATAVHDTLYYYKGSRLVGVRHGPWKYLRRHLTDNGGYVTFSQGPFLFHLGRDPNESYDLIESEPDVAAELAARLDAWDREMARNVRGWV